MYLLKQQWLWITIWTVVEWTWSVSVSWHNRVSLHVLFRLVLASLSADAVFKKKIWLNFNFGINQTSFYQGELTGNYCAGVISGMKTEQFHCSLFKSKFVSAYWLWTSERLLVNCFADEMGRWQEAKEHITGTHLILRAPWYWPLS